MKKYVYSLLIILLLPVIVLAENVSIKSINLIEKGDFVEIVKEPTYEGLNINFDMKFNNVGDSATYKVELENKDEENYFINLKADVDSKYILYKLDSDLDTNIVKGKSTTTIYVIVKYENEVPSYKLTNNKYSETKTVKISLTNNKGEEVITDTTTKNAVVVNPNTGNIVLRIKNSNIVISLYTVGIVLLIAIVAIIVLKKLKVKKYLSMMLVLSMILIPGISKALKEITLTINSKIEIEPVKLIDFTVYKVDVDGNSKKIKYKAVEGMTLDEWEKSKYNVDKIDWSYMTEEDMNECHEGLFIEDEIPGQSNITFRSVSDYEMLNGKTEIDSNKNYYLVEEDCKIHFTIKLINGEEKNYVADLGMTWGEWLESEYNVDNIHFENSHQSGYCELHDKSLVFLENCGYDDIIENRYYKLKYWVECDH